MIHNQQKINKVGSAVLWFVGILLVLAVAMFAGKYYFFVGEYQNKTSQTR